MSARPTEALVSLGFFAAALAPDFLRVNFVEVVLTYFQDFRITTKKIRVHLHHRMFLWIDYNIIDPVFTQQGRGFRPAGIYLFDVPVALAIIDSMRPDVSGIAHHRSPAGQKYRRVVDRRVQDRGPGRRL